MVKRSMNKNNNNNLSLLTPIIINVHVKPERSSPITKRQHARNTSNVSLSLFHSLFLFHTLFPSFCHSLALFLSLPSCCLLESGGITVKKRQKHIKHTHTFTHMHTHTPLGPLFNMMHGERTLNTHKCEWQCLTQACWSKHTTFIWGLHKLFTIHYCIS